MEKYDWRNDKGWKSLTWQPLVLGPELALNSVFSNVLVYEIWENSLPLIEDQGQCASPQSSHPSQVSVTMPPLGNLSKD